jgi:hypothetical protein
LLVTEDTAGAGAAGAAGVDATAGAGVAGAFDGVDAEALGVGFGYSILLGGKSHACYHDAHL